MSEIWRYRICEIWQSWKIWPILNVSRNFEILFIIVMWTNVEFQLTVHFELEINFLTILLHFQIIAVT